MKANRNFIQRITNVKKSESLHEPMNIIGACLARHRQKLKKFHATAFDIINSKKSRELAPMYRPNGSKGGGFISISV